MKATTPRPKATGFTAADATAFYDAARAVIDADGTLDAPEVSAARISADRIDVIVSAWDPGTRVRQRRAYSLFCGPTATAESVADWVRTRVLPEFEAARRKRTTGAR